MKDIHLQQEQLHLKLNFSNDEVLNRFLVPLYQIYLFLFHKLHKSDAASDGSDNRWLTVLSSNQILSENMAAALVVKLETESSFLTLWTETFLKLSLESHNLPRQMEEDENSENFKDNQNKMNDRKAPEQRMHVLSKLVLISHKDQFLNIFQFLKMLCFIAVSVV